MSEYGVIVVVEGGPTFEVTVIASDPRQALWRAAGDAWRTHELSVRATYEEYWLEGGPPPLGITDYSLEPLAPSEEILIPLRFARHRCSQSAREKFGVPPGTLCCSVLA